jgi:hypothetical protein
MDFAQRLTKKRAACGGPVGFSWSGVLTLMALSTGAKYRLWRLLSYWPVLMKIELPLCLSAMG